MSIYLVVLYFCDQHNPQKLWKTMVYLTYTFREGSLRQEKKGKNLELAIEAGVVA